jgi:hypothetical protein
LYDNAHDCERRSDLYAMRLLKLPLLLLNVPPQLAVSADAGLL